MATRSLFGGSSNRASRRSRLKEKRKNDETKLRIKGETNTISGKIELARSTVERLLGYLRDELICITEEEELVRYIDTCIKDVIVGIDTETDSLDWLGGHIAGLCLYSESQKGCYIPINHVSYMTGQRLKNQISQEVVGRELKRLVDSNAKFIFHNAKFDKHVIIHNFGFDIKAYWDTQIAACLLNENEPHGLKYLWNKYCKSVTEEEESQPIATFSTLFENVSFVQVPLDIAPLYAAEDPVKTFELYKFQKKVFERKSLAKVYKVFTDIEMPVLEVVTDMEETGVVLDVNLGQQLSERYHGYLKRIEGDINREYEKLKPMIVEFKSKNKSLGDKLEDPINFGSTTQLAILIYDVLKLESPDRKSPRGTGSAIIEKLQDKADILKYITEYREMGKLLGTYIDKLPNCISPVDNKLHGSYNQLGAKTGRFSSSDPNLQNIPSHPKKLTDGTVVDAGKDIRQMFSVPEGYCMFGGDFSGQEVRLMADMCGDENMIKSYIEGKDLYSTIASLAFDKPYEECCEFAPDGSKNPSEYKERRSQAKSIVLGINYGRGIDSIAEQINKTKEEAQEIQDKVFKSFPGISRFIEESQEMARKTGYVEDRWGRKRRLPDMQLPKLDVVVEDITKLPQYNPLADETELENLEYVDDETWYYFIDKFNGCKWYSQKKKVCQEAESMGYKIIDNSRKVADAERQCVNARIQGSAASQAKIAMAKIYNNKEFRELGGRIILQIHDEIICICPIPNIKRCSELLADIMSNAIPDCNIPFPVDVTCNLRWYGKDYTENEIIELYEKGKLDTIKNLY